MYLISFQSLNLDCRRDIKDDVVATIPFDLYLSSVAIRESPNSIPYHSLMLYLHIFFCQWLAATSACGSFWTFLFTFFLSFLLLSLSPAKLSELPVDLEMLTYHLSSFTMVWRSSWTQTAFCILLQTSSFVTWSL